MKYLMAFSFASILFLMACSDSQRDIQNNLIVDMENKLTNDTSLVMNKTIALELSRKYASFSNEFPEDSLAPVYLFKAGEMAMNLNIGSKSIEYFNTLLNNYPNYKKLPETVFLKAFVFENLLGDLDKAKEVYSKFLNLYPEHILYKDAKASISNMGKSLEEIIKEFEEKNKNADSLVVN